MTRSGSNLFGTSLLAVVFFAMSFSTSFAALQEGQRTKIAVRNGNMQTGEIGEMPTGWYKPGVKAGTITLANEEDVYNKVCLIESSSEKYFTNAIQSHTAANLIGKRIRMRARVRSEVAEGKGSAQMWMRIDGPNGSTFLDNMSDRPIMDNEWATYDIVGDVIKDSKKIVVGVFLKGKGASIRGLFTSPVQLSFARFQNRHWLKWE